MTNETVDCVVTREDGTTWALVFRGTGGMNARSTALHNVNRWWRQNYVDGRDGDGEIKTLPWSKVKKIELVEVVFES